MAIVRITSYILNSTWASIEIPTDFWEKQTWDEFAKILYPEINRWKDKPLSNGDLFCGFPAKTIIGTAYRWHNGVEIK